MSTWSSIQTSGSDFIPILPKLPPLLRVEYSSDEGDNSKKLMATWMAIVTKKPVNADEDTLDLPAYKNISIAPNAIDPSNLLITKRDDVGIRLIAPHTNTVASHNVFQRSK